MKSARRLQQHATWTALREAVEHYRGLHERVARAAPPSLRPHIVAVALRDDALHVWLDSPAWATRLHQSQLALLDALKDAGLPRPQRVRTHVRPAERPSRRPVRRATPPPPETPEQLTQLADSIQHPKLQERLRKLADTLRRQRR
ncbi:DciA family protein [Sulfurivirga sp.]|uniref:DciA family protein n=1 Tax=Sulfurivirga sp. TaxID=2614236 RepID=UPI0025FD111A|nr:DciA family protein [Sulfurivirga sp.]